MTDAPEEYSMFPLRLNKKDRRLVRRMMGKYQAESMTSMILVCIRMLATHLKCDIEETS